MINEGKKSWLTAQIASYRKQLWEIENKEAEEKTLPMVGKCFRVRNSYSMPQKQSDYWWLYRRVIRARGSTLWVDEFQSDCHGQITVMREKQVPVNFIGRSEEISLTKYCRARVTLLDSLKKWAKK
jgi:hypothetical protein